MSAKALQYLAEFQPRKALPLLRKAASPINYGSLINYAAAQRGSGLIHEAIETLKQALALDQSKPEAWCNLAQCHEDLGDFEKAPMLFQRALQIIEKSPVPVLSATEPMLGFAYSSMRLGQFPYVWPIWEAARFNNSWHPFPPLHPWRGEPDARLLVLPEGGFGDGFNFLRWLPTLRIPRITLLVWDSMFEYAKYILDNGSRSVGIQVLPMSHKFQYSELARFTHCTPYLSLMCHSLKQWSDIPAPLNWEPRGRIVAEPNDWIGFCWRAEENGVMRRTRSLDNGTAARIARQLKHLCERVVGLSPSGKHLYRSDDERKQDGLLMLSRYVIQDDSLLDGWEQTALTLLKCRMVVTVDTAVAHLSGSLGVPTLILLPMRSDWKWGTAVPPRETVNGWDVMHDGSLNQSAFYGSNVKLYRNDHPVDWSVDKIREAIRTF